MFAYVLSSVHNCNRINVDGIMTDFEMTRITLNLCFLMKLSPGVRRSKRSGGVVPHNLCYRSFESGYGGSSTAGNSRHAGTIAAHDSAKQWFQVPLEAVVAPQCPAMTLSLA
jgi:hypothetical protein